MKQMHVSCRKCNLNIVMLALLVSCSLDELVNVSMAFPQGPAESDFLAAVRETKPLTPAAELKSFQVPAGFSVDLVASEPTIQKPMNLSFDARGRLWVSTSSEYPFPAPEGKGKDRIQVFEDTTGDGEFDKSTVFADDLNIPIGLYPYRDGVVCFSIPNIWFLRDTDGDGKCDIREVLYGPFDCSRDTHGMCNGFRRGFDGWVYACHGFNNQSQVSGNDGHQVQLNSGNTFRFKLDGSRIEHFTHGQVNPFGLAWDQYGNLFSADCHTKPLSLLIGGGYYESFGKPHDGLGFVPNVMEHLHGSTAIAGVAIYETGELPKEYHGNSFGGNVMTSRINRNQLVLENGSVHAEPREDFLKATDPWFRPVDIRLSPDGDMFVADFYNRIIGHYEVPLEHPGRDRVRGRIWRIQYKKGRRSHVDLTDQSIEACIDRLSSSSLWMRTSATDVLVDVYGTQATEHLRRVVCESRSHAKHHATWALLRLGKLTRDEWQNCASSSFEANRVHAMQMLCEWDMTDAATEILVAMNDDSAKVQRAACMAARCNPTEEFLPRLLQFLELSNDPHLRYTAKIAARAVLRATENIELACSEYSATQIELLLPICIAVDTQAAAEFLLNRMDLIDKQKNAAEYYAFMATRLPEASVRNLSKQTRSKFSRQLDVQEEILRKVFEAVGKSDYIEEWASGLCCQLMDCTIPAACEFPKTSWVAPGKGSNSQGIWRITERRSASDGSMRLKMLSSYPAGESSVGRVRSPQFELQSGFSFFLAGHDGFPDKSARQENKVLLILSGTKEVVASWPAPRNDVAQLCQLPDEQYVGQQVYLELVDANSERAFAWLAAGKFSVDDLSISWIERSDRARRLIEDLQLTDFSSAIEQAVKTAGTAADRWRYLEMLQAISPHSQGGFLIAAGRLGCIDEAVIVEVVLNKKGLAKETMREAFQQTTLAQQQELARQLVNSRSNGEALLKALELGWCSSDVLADEQLRVQLQAVLLPKDQTRLTEFIKTHPQNEANDPNIQELIVSLRNAKADSTRGEKVFADNCNQCHRVAEKGGQVGPNLDGIGTRGYRRLIEDVLYPNRNVDKAFRASLVITEDGKVLKGLIKSSSDESTVMIVDALGKEHSYEIDEISERRELTQSPMPSNFHETLAGQQLADLMKYLEELR